MLRNWLKTGVLLAALSALLIVMGGAIGGRTGMTIALGFALIMNFVSYWYSDKIVLKIYKARPVSEEENPFLHRIVAELAQRAEIPKPAVYVIPTDVPNAFATGRNPEHGVVAVTEGIMRMLDKRELAGVLAHELSHIKHRDTLVSTVAATIAAAISYLASMGQWALIFGGFGGRDDRGGGNPFAALLMIIIAPLIAMVIQMAVSRSREYMADERGARIAGEAGPLASALMKLERGPKAQHFPQGDATEHLFIVNPFKGKSLIQLLSTHPSTDDRVSRLRKLAGELGG